MVARPISAHYRTGHLVETLEVGCIFLFNCAICKGRPLISRARGDCFSLSISRRKNPRGIWKGFSIWRADASVRRESIRFRPPLRHHREVIDEAMAAMRNIVATKIIGGRDRRTRRRLTDGRRSSYHLICTCLGKSLVYDVNDGVSMANGVGGGAKSTEFRRLMGAVASVRTASDTIQ